MNFARRILEFKNLTKYLIRIAKMNDTMSYSLFEESTIIYLADRVHYHSIFSTSPYLPLLMAMISQ